jgi:hypothetical protein
MPAKNCVIFIFLTALPLELLGGASPKQNVNSDPCDGRNTWREVKFDTLGITSPVHNLDGLRAIEDSCISFPIVYRNQYTLLIRVYMQVVSDKSGLDISLFQEGDVVPYETHAYNKVHKFDNEWYEVIVPIHKNDTERVSICYLLSRCVYGVQDS